MKIYSPRDERETIINFSPVTGKAKIWTNEEAVITKLDKLCEKFPETYKCTNVWKMAGMQDVLGNKEYEVDRKRISFTSPRDSKVPLGFAGKTAVPTAENEDN